MPARRKSDRLHQINGTLRRDRGHAPEREPVAAGRLYAAPPGLTADQRIIWRREIRNAPRNVLAKIDTEILRKWCQVVDRCEKLQKILDADYGQPGWENAAGHRNLDRGLGVLMRLAAELGFTPASRPKLRVEPARPLADDDPWSQLRLVGGCHDPG
jgi:phage terminase small subunit